MPIDKFLRENASDYSINELSIDECVVFPLHVLASIIVRAASVDRSNENAFLHARAERSGATRLIGTNRSIESVDFLNYVSGSVRGDSRVHKCTRILFAERHELSTGRSIGERRVVVIFRESMPAGLRKSLDGRVVGRPESSGMKRTV